MRPLDLADLPAHSAWARYLLDPAGDPPTDPTAYTSVETYDDLYGHILEEYRTGGVAPEELASRIYARGRADPGAVSVGGDLFLASPETLCDRDAQAVRDALRGVESTPDTVFDLGCGWGAALDPIAEALPETGVVGGESAENGVALARALFGGGRLSVEPFDFHGDWSLMEAVAGDSLVFTRGALTTLSDVEGVVDRFAALARSGTVVGGVHLEQVDAHPETTLGLLRRHYARVRGYDTSLLDALRTHEDIAVQAVEYDVLGANPLHPLTAIRWIPA
ncbi:class I SAM-dependent methyltransferase [Halorarius litoreus]|uniref:class I SAM-dependent methyltransferase n=1 Tax=Halorarius litoreus TaxID=2962676 RepID=UPI0020CEC606|nr:class I SAM-dependent methyltransferase [Halorarius litoreus]